MGFFGSIWKGIKKAGHAVGTGIKKVGHVVHQGASAVSKVGHKIHDTIDKAYKAVKKVPVLGDAVDKVVNTQFIPGVSLGRLADVGNLALDGVDAVRDGAGMVENLGEAVEKGNPRKVFEEGKKIRNFGKQNVDGFRGRIRQVRA